MKVKDLLAELDHKSVDQEAEICIGDGDTPMPDGFVQSTIFKPSYSEKIIFAPKDKLVDND